MLIVRIEAPDGLAVARRPDLAAIGGAFETVGVIPDNGGVAGLRLREVKT